MNKKQFLNRLEELLSDISEEERADAIAFYKSYFEDAGEDKEASILQELESPEKAAEAIKKDLSDTAETNFSDAEDTANFKAAEKSEDENDFYGDSAYGQSGWEEFRTQKKETKAGKTMLYAVIGLFTSPIWLSLLLAAVICIFAVVVCIFAIALSIAAIMGALLVCGIILAGMGVKWFFAGSAAVGFGLFGSGLLVLAVGVFFVWITVWCFGWFVPWSVKGAVKVCKKLFENRKEQKFA